MLLDHVDSVEKKEEVDSESEEEDEDDVELDLKNLCSEVAAILRKDAVSLKNVLPQTGISKRLVGNYFLYHDGDHSMQLVTGALGFPCLT